MKQSFPSLKNAVLSTAAVGALLIASQTAYGSQAYCSKTASIAYRACGNDVRDDFWVTRGQCINITDNADRAMCNADAQDAKQESRGECRDQLEGRLDLCDLLGEDRYDPDIAPDLFDADLRAFSPYFPLQVGNTWEYEGGDETVVTRVMDKTKLIEGVTTRVVNDIAFEDGEVLENTDDWYAQGPEGAVWYFGEIAQNYELFEGDDPEEPELTDVDGSWKTGRDGAKPGILFSANPQVGDVYRQEMALGDAEDAAEILTTSYGYGNDADMDQFVPQALAEAYCDNDCLITREFTPLEPGFQERKFYSPGIGLFLEVDVESGHILQLVSCEVDGVSCPEVAGD